MRWERLVIGAAIATIAAVAALQSRPARSAAGHGAASDRPAAAAPTFGYDIVRSYPHDPDAVTQGLIVRDGHFYESTGAHGAPSIRKVDRATGAVVGQRLLAEPHVGEGLTEWRGALVQLTPVRTTISGTAALAKITDLGFLIASLGRRMNLNFGAVCDADSLNVRTTFTYKGEGWGLTHDGRRLVLSDGSAELRFLDPETFAAAGSIQVTDRGKPVPRLNELELVDGRIYANLWLEDRIAIIDPASGRVSGWIDLSALWSQLQPRPVRGAGDVLNGIAYDRAGDRLFVTGKRWPRVFEIRLRANSSGV
ncbi:MAG TPA: glutaminyl-peptide cyclotransferase [Vicinamibacterales bacterium]|nr:glutaminyl-peptide cyclotransferase [Vicinamibacterales bacterium]